MYQGYDIIEVTNDNEAKYLNGIGELENEVLKQMNNEGKTGQLFITGIEDISKYINSCSNNVYIATKNHDVVSAVYVTRGQNYFTYNDITKYFKCGLGYQEYIESKFENKEKYFKRVEDVYFKKLFAFCYARNILLTNEWKKSISSLDVKTKNPIFDYDEKTKNKMFLKLAEEEYKRNKFHEKSELRDSLNYYMSKYMRDNENMLEDYNKFYWLDFKTMIEILPIKNKPETVKKFSEGQYGSIIQTYDKILEYQKLKIYDTSHCKNIKDFYDATPDNTIELDTYITHSNDRGKGLAEILTFEGIQKSLNNIGKEQKKIYIASTLHKENFASKYVSEFFGLKDYIFVNRRNERDRQVHILCMDREQIPKYLEKITKKLAVIHNYNPNNIKFTDKEAQTILEDDENRKMKIQKEMKDAIGNVEQEL